MMNHLSVDEQSSTSLLARQNDEKSLETKDIPKFLVVCGLLLLFGTMNNVGVSMISITMPVFPAWCLYGTTIVYTIMFWATAFISGENPFSKENLTWGYQKHYLILGLLTAANGLFIQFSLAWINGSLAQVLSSFGIIVLPFIELYFFPERKDEYNRKSLLGLGVILVGILVGVIPAFMRKSSDSKPIEEQSNRWYWILALLMSLIFAQLEQVAQDIAFQDRKVKIKKITCLAWYNLYSLPLYLLAILLETIKIVNGTEDWVSVGDAFKNQKEAIACLIGNPSPEVLVNNGCQSTAFLWNMIFCLGYLGLFGINALMIAKWGVLFPNLIGTCFNLLSAVFFMMPAIVGDNASNFDPFPLVACVVIIIGTFIKGVPRRKDI